MFEKINGSHYVEKDAFPALEQLLLGAGTHLFDFLTVFLTSVRFVCDQFFGCCRTFQSFPFPFHHFRNVLAVLADELMVEVHRFRHPLREGCRFFAIDGVGRILRRASLDELPQLWNVLRGDMSLVGPRPMMICQQSLYPGQGYYAVRPGITGYWQTSARNRSTFEARAAFDDAYEADLSLLTDMKVLAATVGVVVHGTGY